MSDSVINVNVMSIPVKVELVNMRTILDSFPGRFVTSPVSTRLM